MFKNPFVKKTAKNKTNKRKRWEILNIILLLTISLNVNPLVGQTQKYMFELIYVTFGISFQKRPSWS